MENELYGIWSNGALNKYYEGSHDPRLVLDYNGKGCYIHDGWWIYGKHTFNWEAKKEKLSIFNLNQTIDGDGKYSIKSGKFHFTITHSETSKNKILKVQHDDIVKYYLFITSSKQEIHEQLEMKNEI